MTRAGKLAEIQLLITDLDNTLYNWYESFVPAFYAMVEKASAIVGVDQEQLLDELKVVHVRYRNTEQPFSLLETPSVERKFPNVSAVERYNFLLPAFKEFSSVRNAKLRLFPGVRETLTTIRSRGCLVLGYSEAVAENSLYRLQLLDLLSCFDRLYVPASRSPLHPDPSRPPMHEDHSQLLKLLPQTHRKPDPAVIEDICSSFGVAPNKTLYVGDSMTRDISMAVMAGTHSALAIYGGSCPPELWQQLVRITHWTDQDVLAEQRLKTEYEHIKPDIELQKFAQLLDSYDFEPTSVTGP